MEQTFTDMYSIEKSPIIDPSDPTIIPEIEETKRDYKTPEQFQTLYAEFLQSRVNNYYYLENYTDIEKHAIYLQDLIFTGDFNQMVNYCIGFSKTKLEQIVNVKPYEMYYGNVLHSTLYSLAGNTAEKFYCWFRKAGAVPCLNYYGELPWNQQGINWSGLPTIYTRDPADFKDTYHQIHILNYMLDEMINPVDTSSSIEPVINPCYYGHHVETENEPDYDSVYDSDRERDFDSEGSC